MAIGNDEHTLPAGWRWAKLGDVCDEKTGIRDPLKEPDKQFTYIDISSIDNTSKNIVGEAILLGKDAPSRARQIVRTHDVIVSTTRPNLNAVARIPIALDNQICSTGFCVLRVGEQIDSSYLFAFVRSAEFVQSLSDLVKGALYPAVTDKQVKAQLIPLPPLPEQKRIAAMLTEQMAAVEKARVAAEARLKAARELPAAYLRDVFESKEALRWQKKSIGDIAETCSGSTPSRAREDYYGGDIPWVKTGELCDKIIDATEEHITALALKENSLRILPAGTLLIAMYGQGQTRGRTALLRIPAATNQACFAILPNKERFVPEYIQYWFRHIYRQLRDETEGRGGNQSNLNGMLLRNQVILLPTLPEQHQIVALLSEKIASSNSMCNVIEKEAAAIKSMPAALLRQAFAGGL